MRCCLSLPAVYPQALLAPVVRLHAAHLGRKEGCTLSFTSTQAAYAAKASFIRHGYLCLIESLVK